MNIADMQMVSIIVHPPVGYSVRAKIKDHRRAEKSVANFYVYTHSHPI
jgi:hypothetical protein